MNTVYYHTISVRLTDGKKSTTRECSIISTYERASDIPSDELKTLVARAFSSWEKVPYKVKEKESVRLIKVIESKRLGRY